MISRKKRYQFELTIAGGKIAIPYLFSIERFMWLDEKADKAFIRYQKALEKIYVKPCLEIEIKG